MQGQSGPIIMKSHADRIDAVDETLQLTIDLLFERQVFLTPDAIALRFEGLSFSYEEVDQRANRLAHLLRKRGLQKESLVGVLMDRSPELIISLLAIMKAGAAYVPLDVSYPATRLHFMIADSRLQLLITRRQHLLDVPDNAANVLVLDAEDTECQVQQQDSNRPDKIHLADNLVYAIYTSGSTGQPKAALLQHDGVTAMLQYMQQTYQPQANALCMLCKTPISFDAAVEEMFWPLCSGGRLVIAGKDGHRDVELQLDLICKEQVTAALYVPSFLRQVLSADDLHRAQSLKTVISAGEALTPELAELFFSKLSARLFNQYGPSEASVYVTDWECGRDAQTIFIGKPINDLAIYILDPQQKIVNADVPGELYISGVALARGYLGKPELTEQKFIELNLEGKTLRVYRTGDLAVRRSTGHIEFSGRIDRQVKIRGVRVELDEIEQVLGSHRNIRESAVVVVNTDNTGEQLHAFVSVRDVDRAPASAELREFLKQRIPEAMLPTRFTLLDSLPCTPNQKRDYAALKSCSGIDLGGNATYSKPANAMESYLSGLWETVLGHERFGTGDHFYDIGGHSLLAARMLALLRKERGIRISFSDFTLAPDIRSLANNMALAQADADWQGLSAPQTSPAEARLAPKSDHQEAPSSPHIQSIITTMPTVKAWETQVTPVLMAAYEDLCQQKSRSAPLRHFPCGHHPAWVADRVLKVGKDDTVIACFRGRHGLIPERVLRAVNAMMAQQSLLNAVLIGRKKDYQFAQYPCWHVDTLPLVDLSIYASELQPELIHQTEQLLAKNLGTRNSLVETVLFNWLVLRLDDQNYLILFAFSDVMSDIRHNIILHRHMQWLNENRDAPADIVVEPYSRFTELTTTDLDAALNRLQHNEEYRRYRNTAAHIQHSHGVSRPFLYSNPYHVEIWPDEGKSPASAMGLGLSACVEAIAHAQSLALVPLRVLVNRRRFGGCNFYNTLGDFHDSVPVVCSLSGNNPESCSVHLEHCLDHFESEKIYLSNLGKFPEVNTVLFRGPFGFNFLGEISRDEARKHIAAARFMDFVPYPVCCYQEGNKISIIFFHGLNRSAKKALKRYLGRYTERFELHQLGPWPGWNRMLKMKFRIGYRWYQFKKTIRGEKSR